MNKTKDLEQDDLYELPDAMKLEIVIKNFIQYLIKIIY